MSSARVRRRSSCNRSHPEQLVVWSRPRPRCDLRGWGRSMPSASLHTPDPNDVAPPPHTASHALIKQALSVQRAQAAV